MAGGTLYKRGHSRVRFLGIPPPEISGTAVHVLGPGLALGLGGLGIGALGAGEIPAAGFGAGTPLSSLQPFQNVNWSLFPTKPTPWSYLGSRATGIGIAPGYSAGLLGAPMGLFGGGFTGGLNLLPQGSGGVFGTQGQSGGWGDVLNAGVNLLGGYLGGKLQLKAQKQQQRLLLRAYGAGGAGMVPTQLNMNPATLAGGLNFGGGPIVSGLLPDVAGTAGGAIGGAVTGGEIAGPVGAAVGGVLGAGAGYLASSPSSRARVPRLVGSVNNQTGRAVFYRYVGAPILFRGDLQTLKTVRKAVSKFGGVAGVRRSTFRRRRR